MVKQGTLTLRRATDCKTGETFYIWHHKRNKWWWRIAQPDDFNEDQGLIRASDRLLVLVGSVIINSLVTQEELTTNKYRK